MQVITIAMQKGGVGKSTIARSLAVAAVRDGLSVLMIDMDSQQSVSQWAERRESDMPVVVFSTENELPKKLAQAKGVADLVIIDTPPARSTEAPAAVEVADLVLIPTTPDVEPLEQMPRTLRLCRGFSRPVFAVVNMANPTGPAEVVYTREVIEAMGAKIAPVVLHRRKAHRDASASGQTVQEVDPKGKAATEVDNLWAWVRAELQGSK
ncbi:MULTISPECIES: ParA family protein [Paracoccus]|jgi:chromosome partitioning protein|uniref:ParA family protein n=1 Tax=Paracoccus haeundaensis TaxID=225362 RepID=A0A5C4R2A3_9RHOB|nr:MULTISPECIES: ParA family protein [Paracoccus]KIX16184.1 ParA [Paracoccus sp. 228]TNH38056.1 ParA family protein [Paracoccus haeundaensis]|tara:strand:- start:971 stop:1597 length:627 start_codon:yes stop_codon:yes gene_type:complete